jgi:Protein of unknown function (DUF4231)
MRWLRRRSEPNVLPSEKGLFELAGRQAGLPLREVAVHFRDLISADMDWADSRKARFRRSSSRVKLASLVLAALATVVLGIEAIPGRSWVALPLVATVTVLGALEPFFNWRSRWVLMEEAQYRLNRLRDEIDYYLTVTPPEAVEREILDRFFADQQLIWNDVSRRWIEFRSLATSQPDEAQS